MPIEKLSREDIMRTINTVLLSVITIVLTVGATMIIDSTKRLNDKLDNVIIQVTMNSAKLEGHNQEASIWIDRIQALEKGEAEATMDRITKSEALEAIDDLKKWVDRYYARKR